jgi:hypothetical protein
MSWFQYLLQVNLYLILLYGFYVLLLKNNTFFRLNRIYILSSGVGAFLLPLLHFDSIRALFITEQVRQTTRNFSTVIASVPDVAATPESSWHTSDWLLACYIAGVIFFSCRFLLQLYAVYKSRSEDPDSPKAHSFFGKIVVSENIEGREIIMEHEEVHASEWHSADVVLFEIIGIVNWFNPIVYAFKRALKFIHEFIADEVVSGMQFTKEDYSLLLLSNVFGIRTKELSNNFFNQSLLKRRIIMLHKTKSRKIALVKYTLCIPHLAVMLIFSSSTVNLQDYSKPFHTNNLLETVSVALKNEKKEIHDLKKDSQVKKDEVKDGKPSAAQFPPPEAPASQIEQNDLNNTEPDPFQPDPVVQMEAVQVLPAFPGGKPEWAKFLQGYNYPPDAREHNASGKVIIGFIVEKDGSLSGFNIIRDLGYGTGEEAIRLLKLSPKWTPGVQNGMKVRVDYIQPIALTLN